MTKCEKDSVAYQISIHWWNYAYLPISSQPKSAMVCTPHKVASQTWRHFFLKLNEKDDPDNPLGYVFPQNSTYEAYQQFQHRVIQTRYHLMHTMKYFRWKDLSLICWLWNLSTDIRWSDFCRHINTSFKIHFGIG